MQQILLITLLSFNLAVFASENSSSASPASSATAEQELAARQQDGTGPCFYRHFLDLSHVTPSNAQLAAYASCYGNQYKKVKKYRSEDCSKMYWRYSEFERWNKNLAAKNEKSREQYADCFGAPTRFFVDTIQSNSTPTETTYWQHFGIYTHLKCQRVKHSATNVTTSCFRRYFDEVDSSVPGATVLDKEEPVSSSSFDNLALLHDIQQKVKKDIDDADTTSDTSAGK